MGSLPAAGYWSNAARTEGEQKQTIEDILKAVKQVPGVGVAVQALTLAGDQVTPADGASGDITIDTEASAATDNLAQILQTNTADGEYKMLRCANASRVVVVKHAAGGTGQLSLKSGGDFTLADPDRHWLLVKRSGTTWKEISRFPDADLAPILSKSANYTQALGDRGQLIDCTATLTLTLLSAATAGKGFCQSITNSGTGLVTFSGTIDGVASLKLQAGDKVEIVSDGTNWKSLSRLISGAVVPAGHRWGLTLSNNGVDATNDIDVAAGECASTATAAGDRARLILGALTKRLDATWVTGTNQGGRTSSQAIADGTWFVFAVRVAGVDDVAFDTSVTGANLIADHAATHVRRIGSIVRAAGAIRGFTQRDKLFQWKTPLVDMTTTNPGTAAVLQTMTVPTGIPVIWRGAGVLVVIDTSQVGVLLTDPATTDTAPSTSLAHLSSGNQAGNQLEVSFLEVGTNTSGQLRYRLSGSNANITVVLSTIGWLDDTL